MVRRCLVLTALVACGPVRGNLPTGDGPTGDPGFAITALTTNVVVPVDGRAGIELSVARTGGFDGEITVAGLTPPNGLEVDSLTIPADVDTAEIAVGALTPLAIGDTVSFTLGATAADLAPQQLDFENADVTGKPGSLDVTWGPNGTGFGPINMGGDAGRFDALEVVAGKVLATGFHQPFSPSSIATTRFTDAGLVDVTFDGNSDPTITDSLVKTNYSGGSNEFSAAVAIGHQNDGRIILIGRTEGRTGSNPSVPNNGVAIVQLAPTGLSGFPTFGNLVGAKARFDLDPTVNNVEETSDGLVLPDNTIVFVGTVAGNQFIGRADASGNLDSTFGGTGFVIESLGGTSSTGNEVRADSNNRLVVLGSTTPVAGQNDLVVSRYTAAGVLDTFGTGGRVTITTGGALTPLGLTILSTGKILVAAATTDGYALFRLNSDGMPDTTFGTGGAAAHPVATTGVAMTVLADGKIMLLGQTGTKASLVRFKANGDVDNLFGTGGLVDVPFIDSGSGTNEVSSIAVYDANRIVIGGSDGGASPGPGRTAALARLWN